MLDQTIAWVLTYLLHGTLLLGLAWLVSKPLGRWSVSAEETVWKLALVGALFTASLQLAAGWEPVAGRWGLADLTAPSAVEEGLVPSRAGATPGLKLPMAALPEPFRAAEATAPETRLPMPSTPALAFGLWALGACLLLAGYARSFSLLRRRLKDRPRVIGGTLHSQLRALAAEAGFPEDVRLTCSSRVPVPLALGLRRPEICVPPKALAGLTDEQQEGMLAHELAHLVRRDPLWLVISHLLACVFFFQPLNWVARRRLREISEMLSDEWAVSHTGRPLSLAGCLAEVAGWSMARRSLPVPSMADRRSNLAQRIRRLLEEGRSPESPARRLWLGAAMVVLLIAVAAAAPAVSAAREEAPARQETPAVQAVAAAPSAAVMAWVDQGEQSRRVEERGEHEVAEKHESDHDSDQDSDEEDFDLHEDFDFDEVEFEGIDYDEIVDHALASVQGSLDALDGQLAQLSEDRELSGEELEKLEADLDRVGDQVERTLEPQLEKLSRELSEKMAKDLPTGQMRKLEVEMRQLGERMRPSEEERARLHAQIDEEVRKHRADDGRLSRDEREKIVRDARRMAEQYKPSEEQRREMHELARRHRELSEQFRAEHRDEIEKATREMREAVDHEMRAVREELQRTMQQRRLIEREQRRERGRDKEMREDRQRDRDREHGEEKPPKMVLRMDLSGKLELVPETPGC
jgi:beta-lactamase regulating signal transducer with metallopeptidase domain